MAHSWSAALLALLVIGVVPSITLNEETWSPVVGFEASTNLAPIHFIELDYMTQDVVEFSVDTFKINVGLLSTVTISNLVGSNFEIDYSQMEYSYQFNEISYSGSSMEVSFAFDYQYDEDLIFTHKGSGTFKCNVSYWHFIDKMLSYMGYINHIVTFQTKWQDTLQDFKITDAAHQSVIEQVLTDQMSVRISMGIEHSVNKIVSSILNANEKQKKRTYSTSIAGLDSIQINEQVNALATNDTEKTMYAQYDGTISYGNTSITPAQGPYFYVEQVQKDAGIIFTEQLFQALGQVSIMEAAQDILVITQTAAQTLTFDMTVASWATVIKGLDSVLDPSTLLVITCSLDSESIDSFSFNIYKQNQRINSEVPFTCVLETVESKLKILQLKLIVSSEADAELADRQTLKLMVKSHLAKGMESVLYVGQSVNNEALATRVSLVLEASDTMFNDYFGEGLVVVAEEYLKLESTPTIVIDEGVLVVTWYSREKEIEVE